MNERRHVSRLAGRDRGARSPTSGRCPRFSRACAAASGRNVDCYHTDDPPALHVVVELPGVDPRRRRRRRQRADAGDRRRAPRGPALDGGVYQQMEIEYGAVPAADRARRGRRPRRGATARTSAASLSVVAAGRRAKPRRGTVHDRGGGRRMSEITFDDHARRPSDDRAARRPCRCCRSRRRSSSRSR